jgi:hypothetical protein
VVAHAGTRAAAAAAAATLLIADPAAVAICEDAQAAADVWAAAVRAAGAAGEHVRAGDWCLDISNAQVRVRQVLVEGQMQNRVPAAAVRPGDPACAYYYELDGDKGVEPRRWVTPPRRWPVASAFTHRLVAPAVGAAIFVAGAGAVPVEQAALALAALEPARALLVGPWRDGMRVPARSTQPPEINMLDF